MYGYVDVIVTSEKHTIQQAMKHSLTRHFANSSNVTTYLSAFLLMSPYL